MNIPDEEVIGFVLQCRENYGTANDDLGVHFCDLALARFLRPEGPSVVFEVLAEPLSRLASTGTLHGIDILATELILAARASGSSELVERVRNLLVAAKRPDATVQVVHHLCDAAREHFQKEDVDTALEITRTALELAVDAGDFTAAASTLELLGACHDRRTEVGMGVLCYQQAALYLDEAGLTKRAAGLRVELAERVAQLENADEADSALEEIAASLSGSDNPEPAVRTYLKLAQLRRGRGKPKAALKALRKGADMAANLDEVSLEGAVYGEMAEAYRETGDETSAASFEARAELLGMFEDE